MVDCYCNCARVVAAAQLEDVNMAGVRSPNMFILLILFLQKRGCCQCRERLNVTCNIQWQHGMMMIAVIAGKYRFYFFIGLLVSF